MKTLTTLSESELKVAQEPNHGLLFSNYKSIVKQNYKNKTSKSLFGIRQRLKSSRFTTNNPLTFVLRLSVFASLLILIF